MAQSSPFSRQLKSIWDFISNPSSDDFRKKNQERIDFERSIIPNYFTSNSPEEYAHERERVKIFRQRGQDIGEYNPSMVTVPMPDMVTVPMPDYSIEPDVIVPTQQDQRQAPQQIMPQQDQQITDQLPNPFVAQQFDVPQWQAPQQAPQQDQQGILSRIGSGIKDRVQDPNFMDRLAIGLSGMSMHPNKGVIATSANRIEQRQKLGLINEQKNRTIQALQNMNTPQAMKALQLLEAGGSIADATKMAFTKPVSNIEYKVVDGNLVSVNTDTGDIKKAYGSGKAEIYPSANLIANEEEDLSQYNSYGAILERTNDIQDLFGFNPDTGDFEGDLQIGLGGLVKGNLGGIGIGGNDFEDVAMARQKFDRFKTKLINDSLRLNKGPQTDQDARRAEDELGNAKTTQGAYAAIQDLIEITRKSKELTMKAIQDRRKRYGMAEIEFNDTPPKVSWRVVK